MLCECSMLDRSWDACPCFKFLASKKPRKDACLTLHPVFILAHVVPLDEERLGHDAYTPLKCKKIVCQLAITEAY